MPQQPSLSGPPIDIAPNRDASTPPDWRHPLWLAFLVAASVAFSFGFACAVPFAAFGAATEILHGQTQVGQGSTVFEHPRRQPSP